MRRLPAAALTAIVWTGSAVSTGCGHARETDAARPKPQAEAAAAPGDHPSRHKTETAPKATPDTPPKAVPVAASPEALLEPGAENKIRDKLMERGFLGKDARDAEGQTREALRRFQRAQDLPATGVPDHETVRKLGLEPNDVFRRTIR